MTARRADEGDVGVVLQMVQQNHDQAEAGHARLRGDWREHDQRIEKMDAQITELRLKLERVTERRTDISTAIIPAKVTAAIVVSCLAIAGGMWRVAARVDDLSSQMTQRAKLEDERHETNKAALEDLKREVKLYELKTENVERALVSKGVIR